jgi:hypothetical protein
VNRIQPVDMSEPTVGFCEHGDEALYPIKAGNVLDMCLIVNVVFLVHLAPLYQQHLL